MNSTPDQLPDDKSPTGSCKDAWARSFFERMFGLTLDTDEFEAVVRQHWENGNFVVRAPDTAQWLRQLAVKEGRQPAGYSSDAPHLGFTSQWLVGTRGYPGAIHIQAPPEVKPATDTLSSLNRPPHQHDSGRIAVVTQGKAVFHVLRKDKNGEKVIDCPVKAGDMIFWPSWTPHTFNAQQGFWLVSAMASYVAPDEDGFVFPIKHSIDELPRNRFVADPSLG